VCLCVFLCVCVCVCVDRHSMHLCVICTGKSCIQIGGEGMGGGMDGRMDIRGE